MSIIWTIVIVIATAIYVIVATIDFVRSLEVEAIGMAFGWPGLSPLLVLIRALLWPILWPIGLLLDIADKVRGRN
jgi:hypothetical protein